MRHSQELLNKDLKKDVARNSSVWNDSIAILNEILSDKKSWNFGINGHSDTETISMFWLGSAGYAQSCDARSFDGKFKETWKNLRKVSIND